MVLNYVDLEAAPGAPGVPPMSWMQIWAFGPSNWLHLTTTLFRQIISNGTLHHQINVLQLAFNAPYDSMVFLIWRTLLVGPYGVCFHVISRSGWGAAHSSSGFTNLAGILAYTIHESEREGCTCLQPDIISGRLGISILDLHKWLERRLGYHFNGLLPLWGFYNCFRYLKDVCCAGEMWSKFYRDGSGEGVVLLKYPRPCYRSHGRPSFSFSPTAVPQAGRVFFKL